MNKQEIFDMQPGPQMRALIAEHVMGYQPGKWHDGAGLLDWKTPGGSYTVTSALPDWPVEIAPAWAVFEHILDPNRDYLQPCGNGQDGLWWAYYRDDAMLAWGETAPLAICRAALILSTRRDRQRR